MTTLIILVVAVLLAGLVTYFAINVTGTRVEEESLSLMKQHIWYNSQDQTSEAAILLVNSGGRDIVINMLTVRGQSVNWGSVFYFEGGFQLPTDIAYIPSITSGSLTNIDDGHGGFEAVMTTDNELTLPSGYSMVLYIKNPDSIATNDVGLTVAISIYTSQAMYHKETNILGYAATG